MPEQPLESIVLYDEDENEIEFDIMDKLVYKGETYYVRGRRNGFGRH